MNSWEQEFNEKFTFGGMTGVISLKTRNATEIKSFIRECLSLQRQATIAEKDKEFLFDLQCIGHTEVCYPEGDDEDHDCDVEQCDSLNHYMRVRVEHIIAKYSPSPESKEAVCN